MYVNGAGKAAGAMDANLRRHGGVHPWLKNCRSEGNASPIDQTAIRGINSVRQAHRRLRGIKPIEFRSRPTRLDDLFAADRVVEVALQHVSEAQRKSAAAELARDVGNNY